MNDAWVVNQSHWELYYNSNLVPVHANGILNYVATYSKVSSSGLCKAGMKYNKYKAYSKKVLFLYAARRLTEAEPFSSQMSAKRVGNAVSNF